MSTTTKKKRVKVVSVSEAFERVAMLERAIVALVRRVEKLEQRPKPTIDVGGEERSEMSWGKAAIAVEAARIAAKEKL